MSDPFLAEGLSVTPVVAVAPVLPAPPTRAVSRVEYLDFRDVDDHREYRFRVYGREGACEFRARIAKAAFDARLLRVSDGPDLCYQKLVRSIAAGATASPDEIITTDEADFVRYRVEHTPVPKRRASWKPAEPAEAATPAEPRPRPQYRPRPERRVAPPPPPVVAEAEPALHEGQRVKHAVFGMGVVAAPAASDRTVVCFDGEGPKSFVSSMLEVEVLSAPHTWETSSRGTNRARKDTGESGDSPT